MKVKVFKEKQVEKALTSLGIGIYDADALIRANLNNIISVTEFNVCTCFGDNRWDLYHPEPLPSALAKLGVKIGQSAIIVRD